MKRISGLILSAGESSRMGTPKAMLRFPSGKTLLEDQCRRLKEAGIGNIFVVVGCDAEKIKNAHKNLAINWVVNKDWRLGNFSSVVTGVKYAACNSHSMWRPQSAAATKLGKGILLLPVDVAGVEIEIIRQIIAKGIRTDKNIIPTHNGRGGHPVYIRPQMLETIVKEGTEAIPYAGATCTCRHKLKSGRLDYILNKDPATSRVVVTSRFILNNINTENDWNNYLGVFLKQYQQRASGRQQSSGYHRWDLSPK